MKNEGYECTLIFFLKEIVQCERISENSMIKICACMKNEGFECTPIFQIFWNIECATHGMQGQR